MIFLTYYIDERDSIFLTYYIDENNSIAWHSNLLHSLDWRHSINDIITYYIDDTWQALESIHQFEEARFKLNCAWLTKLNVQTKSCLIQTPIENQSIGCIFQKNLVLILYFSNLKQISYEFLEIKSDFH
jgi:hypothetical protein